MENYEFHPLSELFPLMNQEGLRELGIDMKNNGQEEAIVLFEGKILDERAYLLPAKRKPLERLVCYENFEG